MPRFFKQFKVVLLVIVFLLVALFFLSRGHIYGKDELEYGLTFSKKQAERLDLDWQKMYLAILGELKIKKLRLSAYWDEVEKNKDGLFWEDLDWQIKMAGESGVEIILAVGGRLPRWPECHWPEWAENLDKETRKKEILDYIKNSVERYRDNKQITAWQIENEPFLDHFGDCPILDKKFLDKEIALVRSLDQRPIVVTDSGELSFWIGAARRADIFGTTMYRDTYSRHLKMYIHYPIGPGFFRLKKNLVSLLARPKKWIVIELQAEPWGPQSYKELSRQERDRTMNLEKFREILEFARQTGFREFYLWGAEWWYWERETQNNPALWEEAKGLFNF